MRSKIKNRFMMKLRYSGYNLAQRVEILLCGLRGYERMCRDEDTGKRRINRSRKDGAKVRRIRKLIGKTEWF